MDDPTIDMWRALIDFRARHGRYWKQALRHKWMTGGDEAERYSSSLRAVRNRLGPSWLYALRPARLDAQERSIALLDRLPVMCATHNRETGKAILLKRGESGFWPLPDGITAERFNAAFAPTPAQIAAMEIGSAFGWDVPGADPAYYDASGRPLAAGSGGKRAEEGCGHAERRTAALSFLKDPTCMLSVLAAAPRPRLTLSWPPGAAASTPPR